MEIIQLVIILVSGLQIEINQAPWKKKHAGKKKLDPSLLSSGMEAERPVRFAARQGGPHYLRRVQKESNSAIKSCLKTPRKEILCKTYYQIS